MPVCTEMGWATVEVNDSGENRGTNTVLRKVTSM